jgi:hypothetical protein
VADLTWKRIAMILGGQMEDHAFCEDHPVSEPEPQCPFCEDRAAYRLFVAKLKAEGVTRANPWSGLRNVPLSKISIPREGDV